jgi:hypothetical protein
MVTITRVQTGVRMEQRTVKVLKALAELLDLSLGDLLEGIVLHAFEGKAPFSAETMVRIAELKRIYGLELRASDSHRLVERRRARGPAGAAPAAAPAQKKQLTPRRKGKKE